MKEAPKIIFLGTPEFAVDSLDILIRNGYQVAAVVTAPDQPAGRGQVMRSPAIKIFALNAGIKVLQPEKLKNPSFIQELSDIRADLFIVVAFRMLPEIVWQMPPMGTFNLHASLLPQYRGAAPINHAIINGEQETGLTTFFLKQAIDTGEIIFQEKIPIHPEETAGDLHDRMKVSGARLVLKTVEAITSGNVNSIEQGLLIPSDQPLKSAPKIFKEDCRIDWDLPSDEIFNKIRGLSPYPTAFTSIISPSGQSSNIKIYKAGKSINKSDDPPGIIVTDSKSFFGITSTDGIILIEDIQIPGKKVMKTEEFLRGFRLNTDWKVG